MPRAAWYARAGWILRRERVAEPLPSLCRAIAELSLARLTLTLTHTLTLTLGCSLSGSHLLPYSVRLDTSGLRRIRGPQIARKPPRNANLKSPYLGLDRAEISRLLRFGEISPLFRLRNTCFYVLRNRGGLCYPVFTVGTPNQNQNKTNDHENQS